MSLLLLLLAAGRLRGAVAGELLHLLLQLFGVAAQHFLLPALLDGLLFGFRLLLGELLLPLRELLQLLQRLVDRPFLALSCGLLLAGLILIFFGIELQVEQVGQIAAGVLPPPPPAATAAEGNLNIAECRFGAQQVLQGFLFRLQRILPRLAPSACPKPAPFASRPHPDPSRRTGIPDSRPASSRLRARSASDFACSFNLV